jgi:hypothetical protein
MKSYRMSLQTLFAMKFKLRYDSHSLSNLSHLSIINHRSLACDMQRSANALNHYALSWKLQKLLLYHEPQMTLQQAQKKHLSAIRSPHCHLMWNCSPSMLHASAYAVFFNFLFKLNLSGNLNILCTHSHTHISMNMFCVSNGIASTNVLVMRLKRKGEKKILFCSTLHCFLYDPLWLCWNGFFFGNTHLRVKKYINVNIEYL